MEKSCGIHREEEDDKSSNTRNDQAYIYNIVKVIKSRRLRMAGDVPRMEESRSAFKILTGKPTGKETFREA